MSTEAGMRKVAMLGLVMVTGACATQVEAPGAEAADVRGGDSRGGLSAEDQRARTDAIRAVAAERGSTSALLFAAIAYHESGLAQCWSEATWTCQGPWSDACGGPVMAGASDGPCANEQGGIGMFQLDSGTYGQTLGVHGADVLSPAGNTRVGMDFIIHKVRVCPNTPQFGSNEEVVEWMNSAVPGTAEYDAFMTAMAWCYNGCAPSYTSCNHGAVKAAYSRAADHLLNTLGHDYWYGVAPPPEPAAGCGDVTYAGYCDGDTVVWCENDELRIKNCGAQGRACAWESDAVGFNCVEPPPPPPPPSGCGDLTYQGFCDGSTLTWCENDEAKSYDCGAAGRACGWESDAVGFNCL